MARFATHFWRSSIVWGGLCALLVHFALDQGWVQNVVATRYLAGDGIKTLVTMLFCIGGVALLRKWKDVSRQRAVVAEQLLPEIPQGGQLIASIPQLLALLRNKVGDVCEDYLPCRLQHGLEAILRRGNGDRIEVELRSLAARDANRAVAGDAFLGALVWGMPIVGLMDTLIGLSASANPIIPKQLDAALSTAAVGFGTAFDALVLSLGFAVTLMFARRFVAQAESSLLAEVDAQATSELSTRFPSQLAVDDPLQAVVERLLNALQPQQDRLLRKQIELWQTTVDEAHDHWTQLSAATGEQLTNSLADALQDSLTSFAETLVAKQAAQVDGAQSHWGGVQQALERATDVLVKQQADMARQGVILLKVADASKHIAQTEATLNENLRTLNATQQFQETMVALSATLQLLAARIHALPNEVDVVELPRIKKTRGRAA